VKPPAFEYCAPETVEDVLELLEEYGDEAKVLAGGQSLVPLLNLRVIRPSVLVDLNGVAGLSRLENGAGAMRIGATVRQRALELDGDVAQGLPLLREAIGLVAHIPIRTRGTLGGSVVHADPAAEIPAVTVALRATMHVAGRKGTRAVPASEFYRGPFTTGLAPAELLVSVEFPPQPPDAGWAFVEVARVHGAFALVGVAALLHAGSDGALDDVRLALCGVGGTPVEILGLDDVVLGEQASERLLARVARHVRATIEPFSDNQAGAGYRREVAGAVSARALRLAAARAGLEVTA
jgi:carbon-monoxide dehydrogenase medium subunit